MFDLVYLYFPIEGENLEEELNNEGPVPESLKEMLKKKGIPLPNTSTIKKANGKWQIEENERISIDKKKGVVYLCYSTSKDIEKFYNSIIRKLKDRIDNMKELNGHVIKHFLYIYGVKYPDHKITFVGFTNSDKFKFSITPVPPKNWLGLIEQSVRDDNEIGIKKIGIDLWNAMEEDIKTKLKELQNGDGNNVWIFYEGEDIEYPWEWIYWGFSDDGSYWGDIFHIVRIPAKSAKAPKFQDRDFRIENVAILRDRTCNITNESNCLTCLSEQVREKNLNDCEDLFNLNENFDYIHLRADRGSFNPGVYSDAIDKAKREKNNNIRQRGDEGAGDTNKSKILFLNISKSNINSGAAYSKSMSDILGELLNLIPVEAWIYTNTDVPDEDAPTFPQYFYNVFPETEKNMVKAVTESRKRIRNEINGIKKFYRFAYIACGNPSINVTDTAN
jgi:hypothetical protein